MNLNKDYVNQIRINGDIVKCIEGDSDGIVLTTNILQPFTGSIDLGIDCGKNLFDRYEPYKQKIKMPKKYIINKGATILFWDDNEKEKTIVKKTKGDKFDKRLGFLTAYFQHYSGLSKTQANKYLDNLEMEDE